jgi:hypothetical protein
MNALKRETTMAKRFPAAFSSPSIAFGGSSGLPWMVTTISPGNSREKLRSPVLGFVASASNLNLRLCAISNTASGFVTSITSNRFTSFNRARTSSGYSLASEFKLSSPSGADKIADR